MTVATQPLTRSARRRLKDPAAHLARTLERSVSYTEPKGPAERPPLVRIAGVSDETGLWPLLEMEAAENAMVRVAWHKVRAVMQQGTRRQGGVVGVIPDPDTGVLVATVGLSMEQPWYSEVWGCQEMWNFVHPDHRRAKHNYANMLIDFSKWWAEQLGMPLWMGVCSNERTIGKVRLYARRIPFVGGIFLHNLSAASAKEVIADV